MFAAYSSNKNNDGRANNIRRDSNHHDPKGDDRWAIQRTTGREHTQIKRRQEKQKDLMVLTQSGYAESDSDSDGGARVNISLPEEQHVEEDDIFLCPEKKKQLNSKLATIQSKNNQYEESCFRTFPTAASKIPFNPYLQSSSSYTRENDHRGRIDSDDSEKDRRQRRRRRSRSKSPSREERSMYSGRESDRRAKKKKHRRRRSSSSSESSDSSRERRKRQKMPVMSKAKQKYSFISDIEYKERDQANSTFIIRDTSQDYENYSLGQNKREIAKCRLDVRYIDGLENKKALFNKIYGVECIKDKKETRSFYENLASIARHIPTEKFIRPVQIKDGFWKISAEKDIRNDFSMEMDGSNHMLDVTSDEHTRLKKIVRENKYDVGAWLKLIELEDELYQIRDESFVPGARKALIERKMALLESAERENKTEVTFPLLYTECMIQLDFAAADILHRYRHLCHTFPYVPMVWVKYLDYVQYNGNVYEYKIMDHCFTDAMQRIAGLVDGTNLAQSPMIADKPQFNLFQLQVFIRYLKWQISSGFGPLALSNIQATFELNFGLPDELRGSNAREKMIYLEEFWERSIPRIGDLNAVGAAMSAKIASDLSEKDVSDMEKVSYSVLCDETIRALKSSLQQDRNLATNWVEFERKMMEADARPKRTEFKESDIFLRDAEEIEGIDFWPKTYFCELRPYINTSSVEFVQPLLELLGITFPHSTGCFSLSEKVVDTWRSRTGSIMSDNLQFEQVPTYYEKTFTAVGKRILKFIIHSEVNRYKSTPDVINERLFKYVMAWAETEANEMEKTIEYYKLSFKTFEVLLVKKIGEELTEVFKSCPLLQKVVQMTMAERFITWWERGLNDQNEINSFVNKATEKNLVVTESRKTDMQKIERKMGSLVQACLPDKEWQLRNKSIGIVNIQLFLFSLIHNARLASDPFDCPNWERLAKAILGMVPKEFLEYRNNAQEHEIAERVRSGMKEIVIVMRQREIDEKEAQLLPEFPGVVALAESLQMIVEYKLLSSASNPRMTVDNLVSSVFKKCNNYQQAKMKATAAGPVLERLKWDAQFLIDTMVRVLSSKDLHIMYNENYNVIVNKAADLFPSEAKYMRLLADANSGSTVKSIRLNHIISERNKKISAERLRKFDIDLERQQLMNSLTVMYSFMRLGSNGGNPQSKYNRFLREAQQLRDPAIWRLAVKAAADVSLRCLEKDAYVRSQGQCPWSLNIHFDFIERMKPSDPEPGETNFLSLFMHRLAEAPGLHQLYIEDWDLIDSYREIVRSRR